MSSERSIPHLRDIFGLSSYSSLSGGSQKTSDSYHHANLTGTSDTHSSGKQSKKRRDKSGPNGTGDVKTLERHLSMKKTIRKKIMRDLQQAFVDDPNEFKVENPTPDQLKAELNAEALRFGDNRRTRKSDNFLDMLRGENQKNYDYQDGEHRNQKRGGSNDFGGTDKPSFWSRLGMRKGNKR
ncbi:uncharacterized protein LOC129790367 [Lutzomyia longipalpis]|uniref:uncharacterized protein LOC129790367 n=1 Tax=Lutzomyia longipalpis TaxID=7200 RepID=UPI002484027E|nr:uncharacterized protein LOC129790367 [Lutzomyia longipalpis]